MRATARLLRTMPWVMATHAGRRPAATGRWLVRTIRRSISASRAQLMLPAPPAARAPPRITAVSGRVPGQPPAATTAAAAPVITRRSTIRGFVRETRSASTIRARTADAGRHAICSDRAMGVSPRRGVRAGAELEAARRSLLHDHLAGHVRVLIAAVRVLPRRGELVRGLGAGLQVAAVEGTCVRRGGVVLATLVDPCHGPTVGDGHLFRSEQPGRRVLLVAFGDVDGCVRRVGVGGRADEGEPADDGSQDNTEPR